MNHETDTFQFTLTTAELGWLAGSMNIIALPLPASPHRNPNTPEWFTELEEGRDSLIKRGLIRRQPGMVWQVDRLAMVMVTWMVEAHLTIQIEALTPPEAAREAWIYVQRGQGLWVEAKADGFELTFFKENSTLARWVNDFADVTPPATAGDGGIITLLQPRHFLPLAWSDQEKAKSVLQHAGIKAKETAKVMNMIAKVNKAVFITHMKLKSGHWKVEYQMMIACGQSQAWGGSATAKSPDTWNLESLDSSKAKKLLHEAIKPVIS